MAETHLEISKVWIAEGCIVCDACEIECPEVFDVQEETCIIKPEALKPDFTKPLTPAIIAGAEGCPVDVIKYETVEVAGPEPEAWKEQHKQQEAAAASAAGDAGGDTATSHTAAAAPVSRAAPDPKWVALLESTQITGKTYGKNGTADDTPTTDDGTNIKRAVKVPAIALKQYLPQNAPPDAQFAAMVGTGFVKPRPSMADRIKTRAKEITAAAKGGTSSRRGFMISVAIGWAGIVFVFATFIAWFQAFMVPRAPIQKPQKVRVGTISRYSELGVYEDFKKDNIWIVTLEEEGKKRVVALSTICTHLGCIPNWLSGAQIFKCPCHGSGYRINGVNFEGPAPRPLERYAMEVDNSGVLIIDKGKVFRSELGQWNDPASYQNVA